MRNIFKQLDLNKLTNESNSLWQFIKFGIVGLSNTLISLAIYYIFIGINSDLYLWGNFVGWIVSVANAFYWGNKVVFKAKDNTLKSLFIRVLKSYATYGFTFLLTQVLLILQVSSFGVSEWIAPIINLIITIPLNFIINKFWTFRKSK